MLNNADPPDTKITFRALAVGVLIAALLGVGAPYENLIISGSPLHLDYSTPAAVVLFFLFFVLVNPLLGFLRRKWLFSKIELVTIYIMGAVACTIPTIGLVCILIPHISAGSYYATPENEWASKTLPYVPSWLRVSDEQAIKFFYEGLPSGETVPWEFTKTGHHCNYAIASPHLLTFRAATAGFLDRATCSTGRLNGFRSGCRNSLIPAGGVLNSPNYAHGCSCSYNMFTSLALVHVPSADLWTYNALAAPTQPAQRLGINLGAPGDRMAANGTLWMEWPSREDPSASTPVEVIGESIRWFRRHSSQIGGDGPTWIAASGVEGPSEIKITLPGEPSEASDYTVRLYFVEPAKHETGQRVFDVAIEGRQVLEDFDVAKEAGGIRRLVVREFDRVSLADELKITFSATKGQAVLSGVEVVAQE
mgnify:CR=1 FL=1